MKKNFSAVEARFAIDEPTSYCNIKLDVNDVEFIAWFDHSENDARGRWPYLVRMKSGAEFFVTKTSGDILENRWLGIKP